MFGEQCPLCEDGILYLKDDIVTSRYKDAPSLTTDETVEIPTCSKCKEQFFDMETAKVLDAALEKAYVKKKESK